MPLSDGSNGQTNGDSHSIGEKMGHDGAMRHNSSIFAFQPSTSVTQFAKNYHTAIATSVSTVIANVIAFPLDFTKARMQTYHGTALGTMKDAYKAEGILAFWRGVGPPLISATVVRTFSMSVYQGLRKTYDRAIHDMTGVSPLEQAETPGRYPSIFTIACFSAAGATSGAITTTFACPFELTKINEQLAGKEARSGSMSAESMKAMNSGSVATARRLIRDRGYAGLYSGYRLHMLRDVIGSSVYFTTYESGKQAVASLRGKNPSDSAAIPAAGFLCGMVSWAIIYPVDVAKTLYQKALLSAGSDIVERPKIEFFNYGAYRGLGVSMLRSGIMNAIFFSIFEYLKVRINALDES